MKKAVFIFRCQINIQALNFFFKRKKITIDIYSLNRRVNDYREQLAIIHLKNIDPRLIASAEVELGNDDHIIFYSVPLAYSSQAMNYIIMGKVPYMATPLICEIARQSELYQLELNDISTSL